MAMQPRATLSHGSTPLLRMISYAKCWHSRPDETMQPSSPADCTLSPASEPPKQQTPQAPVQRTRLPSSSWADMVDDDDEEQQNTSTLYDIVEPMFISCLQQDTT